MRTQIIIFSIIVVLVGCSKSEDPNLPPNQPTNLLPVNGETCESLKPSFSWDASDPEDDELTHTFWLGTTEDNLYLESDNLQSSHFSLVENLDFATRYYWQVESHDGTSSTKSEIVSFSTTGESETGVLPSKPTIIAPKTNTSAGAITFSWNASSNGVGNISYDLFVKHDTETEYSIIKAGLSETTYTNNFTVGSLNWYVEAKDSRGQISRSSVVSITLN